MAPTKVANINNKTKAAAPCVNVPIGTPVTMEVVVVDKIMVAMVGKAQAVNKAMEVVVVVVTPRLPKAIRGRANPHCPRCKWIYRPPGLWSPAGRNPCRATLALPRPKPNPWTC